MTASFDGLPFSTPSAQGVDATGIHRLLDVLETSADVEPHSLMVLRHGYVIAAGWWAPYSADRVHLLYSLSKSFTSTATAFAVAEGLVSLDDRVVDHFPEFAGDITDPASRSMLVRHVASMASGHTWDTWDAAVEKDPAEPVRGFLLLPPERQPGSVFAYNQSATFTLATILQRVTGRTLTEYLRPRLFDPLGIGEVAWLQYDPGRDLGFSGMHATTDAVARLGQLYLQNGVWRGEQLLPAGWAAEATRRQIANPGEPNPDWQQGYGFQFWISRHGYRGDGAYGQFCVVLPEQDMVIAITAATVNMPSVLEAIWQYVLPAVGGKGEDDALQERLSRLALPASQARPHPPEPAAWSGLTFTPSIPQSPVTGVEVRQGWQVVLREHDHELGLQLRTGAWAVSEPASVPTAVTGGWLDANTLRVDVLFLETPHRLVVTCDRRDRTFEARWATEPLHPGSLRDLRAPRR